MEDRNSPEAARAWVREMVDGGVAYEDGLFPDLAQAQQMRTLHPGDVAFWDAYISELAPHDAEVKERTMQFIRQRGV